MATHRYNSAETQQELLDAGCSLFSELGYALANTEDIVGRAGLTRGALYHHFGNKKGLFRAVLEDLQSQLAAEISQRARAVASSGATESLRAGFQTYLDLALRNDVRQVLFVDGPAVLGWEVWQEIDFRHAFGVTRGALDLAMRAGEIDEAPLDELTHVLLGAVTQAGLELGRSSNPKAARREYGKVIDLLVDKLRTSD